MVSTWLSTPSELGITTVKPPLDFVKENYASQQIYYTYKPSENQLPVI